MATPIPSPYDVKSPEYFSRGACLLDRDRYRCQIKLLEYLLEIQEMEDGDEKRARLDDLDDDLKEHVVDAQHTKAMIEEAKAKIAMVDARLKPQEAVSSKRQ